MANAMTTTRETAPPKALFDAHLLLAKSARRLARLSADRADRVIFEARVTRYSSELMALLGEVSL